MSGQDLNNFLSNGRILRVASVGSDGTPHIAPIWYVYENGKFYVQTRSRTRKTQNIKANGKVAFSADVGEAFYDLKAVTGKGTARILMKQSLKRVEQKLDMIITRLLAHDHLVDEGKLERLIATKYWLKTGCVWARRMINAKM